MDDVGVARGGTLGRLNYPQTVLTLTSLSWFLVQGGRLILPGLALPVQESMGIGNAEFGFALTVLWGSYALTQFPGGLVSDDWGPRTVLVVGSVVTGIGYLVLVVAGSYAAFLATATLVGLGIGLLYIPSRTYASEVYGSARGRALGIANASGDASGVVAPVAATVIVAATLPWQWAFVGIALATLAVGVGHHRYLRGAYAVRRPDVGGVGVDAVKQVFRPRVLLVLATYSVFALTWQSSVAFIPLYMFEAKGLSFELGTLMLSLFFLMGVLVKPLAGELSDSVGRNVVAAAALLLGGGFLLVLAFLAEGRLAVIVSVAGFAAALMAFPPATQAYLLELFPDDNAGGSFGISRTVYVLIGSAGPALVGVASETVGYDAAFATFGVALVVSAVVLGVLARGPDG